MLERDDYLDIARGFGISLVVFGHVERGMRDAGLLRPAYPFDAVDFSIYTFHMPLFFFLSGLHLWKSIDKGKRRFLLSKLRTILVPCFVWSIIQGAVQIAASGSVNHPLHTSDWPRLFYDPIGQFWFLYALMMWQMMALVCAQHRRFFFLLTLFAFATQPAVHRNFPIMVASMGIFVAVGAWIDSDRLRRFSKNIGTPLIATLLVLAFAISVFWVFGTAPYYSWRALPSAVFGIASVISVSRLWSGMAVGRPLQRLGRASMDIYVMHILAASGLRIVLMKVGITSTAVHLVMGTAAGVLLPLAAAHVIRRGGRAVKQFLLVGRVPP